MTLNKTSKKQMRKLLQVKKNLQKSLNDDDKELEEILTQINQEGQSLIKQEKVEFICYCIRLLNRNLEVVEDLINAIRTNGASIRKTEVV